MKRNIKKLISVLVVGSMLSASTVVAQAAYTEVSMSSVKTINVVTTTGTSKGVLYKDKSYVPLNVLRSMQTSCFANIAVNYDPPTKNVTITFNTGYNNNPYSKLEVKVINSDSSIMVSSWKEGSNTPEVKTYKNQEIINIDGSLYVPLSIFRDYIGFDVVWNNVEKSVNIPGTFTFTEDDIKESTEELKSLFDKVLNENPDVQLNIDKDTLTNLLESKDKEGLVNAFEKLKKGLDVSDGVHKTADDVSELFNKLTGGNK